MLGDRFVAAECESIGCAIGGPFQFTVAVPSWG